MNRSCFVFELGCEELPSSELPSLNRQLHSLFEEKLASELVLRAGDLDILIVSRR